MANDRSYNEILTGILMKNAELARQGKRAPAFSEALAAIPEIRATLDGEIKALTGIQPDNSTRGDIEDRSTRELAKLILRDRDGGGIDAGEAERLEERQAEKVLRRVETAIEGKELTRGELCQGFMPGQAAITNSPGHRSGVDLTDFSFIYLKNMVDENLAVVNEPTAFNVDSPNDVLDVYDREQIMKKADNANLKNVLTTAELLERAYLLEKCTSQFHQGSATPAPNKNSPDPLPTVAEGTGKGGSTIILNVDKDTNIHLSVTENNVSVNGGSRGDERRPRPPKKPQSPAPEVAPSPDEPKVEATATNGTEAKIESFCVAQTGSVNGCTNTITQSPTQTASPQAVAVEDSPGAEVSGELKPAPTPPCKETAGSRIRNVFNPDGKKTCKGIPRG